MAEPSVRLDPLLWERHAESVTRLARRLVADRDRADELAQDAWAAAVAAGPREAGGLGAWLAAVVRNLARQDARSRARRRAREEAAARGERVPGAAESVARLELHQRVVQAVIALPAHYRDALALRYFEGLRPGAAAARLGVPVETLRTREKRALARLRAELERGARDDGELYGGLALLAGSSKLAPAGAAGVLLMSGKLLAGAGLAGLAALIALVAWNARAPEAREAERVELERAPVAHDGPAVEETGAVAADAPRAASERTELAAPAEDPAAPGKLRGTLALFDEAGARVDAPSGRFSLWQRNETTDRARPVEVDAGRWEIARPSFGFVMVAGFEIEGRTAVFDALEHAVPDEGPLALVARLQPAARLRVLDARTRLDLDGVDLVAGVERFRDHVHPGDFDDARVAARGARSPLELPPAPGLQKYWVTAPGYTWGFVELERGQGGEREVLLERAAELEVTLLGAEPGLALSVRLYPPAETNAFRYQAEHDAPDGGTLLFRGLPPGEYVACAELGKWWDPPRRLAESSVRLAAGERARVTLEIEREALGPPPVPLAGELVLPPGFEELAPSMHVEPLGRAPVRLGDDLYLGERDYVRDAERPGVLAFDAGQVTPGRYVATLSSLQRAFRFEVPNAPLRDLRLELGPLARVEVELVDARSGERLALEDIAWLGDSDEGQSPWGWAGVEREPESGLYLFAARPGRIVVSADSVRHRDLTAAVEVRAGTSRHRLAMQPLDGFWVELRDGETLVPYRWEWRVEARDVLDEDSTARIAHDEGGRFKILVPRPGTWRVSIATPQGYEPVPEFEVVVREGETPEHVVALERAR